MNKTENTHIYIPFRSSLDDPEALPMKIDFGPFCWAQSTILKANQSLQLDPW